MDEIPTGLVPAQVPVFIPVRDRLGPLAELLTWLEAAGHTEIWLIDNDSSWPPLVDFLARTRHRVVRAGANLGHRSPWLTGTVQRHAFDRPYVVSDPDVIPDEDCPRDAVTRLGEILARHPDLDKVGLGLRIDDLPEHYPLADAVRAWEARFWRDEIEPGVFRADVDTTFALYRPMRRRPRENAAVRTAAPYRARHRPWYLDPGSLSDEDRYYRDHADPTVSNWDRSELPRWKQRWLAILATSPTGAGSEGHGSDGSLGARSGE